MNRTQGVLILLLLVLLSGCSNLTTMKKQLLNDYNEQLYIDAQLGFSVKHPLEWQREPLAETAPGDHADSVRWLIGASAELSQKSSEMLIRSFPGGWHASPGELLRKWLSAEEAIQGVALSHSVGPALQLLNKGPKTSRAIIAIEGEQRDFIIALTCPSSRLDDLLPVFNDTVKSFVEVEPSVQ